MHIQLFILNILINIYNNYIQITFKYKHDKDKNGLFYAIGTDFGNEKTFKNPAKMNKIIIKSSEMEKGQAHNFIGREDIDTYTSYKVQNGLFFNIFK